MTRTVATNSCGGTSYSGWSTGSCGCYSGYSWNGWTCVADVTPENGSCGSSLNSCNSGSFGDVADSSTAYLWNCYGIAGGSSKGCSLAKPGQCGSASGGTYSSAPHSASALCALGTSSAVSGSGPWSWTCSTAGGSATCSSAYCAPPIAGSCNNSVLNGCSSGDLVDLADSTTNYLWQCKGLNGGPDSPQCSKSKPPVVGGVCGSSLNTCTSGAFNDTADDATNYNWQCLGSNGGASVNCAQAKPVETYSWKTGSWSNWGACTGSSAPTWGDSPATGIFTIYSTGGQKTRTRSATCTSSSGATVADSFCSGAKPASAENQPCSTAELVSILGVGYGSSAWLSFNGFGGGCTGSVIYEGTPSFPNTDGFTPLTQMQQMGGACAVHWHTKKNSSSAVINKFRVYSGKFSKTATMPDIYAEMMSWCSSFNPNGGTKAGGCGFAVFSDTP